VLPDLENNGIAVEIPLLSCIEAERKPRYALFHIYFRLMAASFDFSQIQTSVILMSTLVVLPDLENMGTAVGIPLLSCIEAERKPRYALFHIYFRLMAASFDFSQIQTSVILMSTLVVLPDLENMGIAVGISFISCIEAEICVISYLLPVNVSHL